MKQTGFFLCSFVVLSFGVATNSGASIIQNGSFESALTPAVPANSYVRGDIPNWSSGTPLNLIFNGNIGGGWPGPQDGQQLADIGNIPAMFLSQTFHVTLASQYNLSWYDSDWLYEATNTAPYVVSIINTGDNSSTYNGTLKVATPGVWNHENILLDLTSGDYTLTFTPTGAMGYVDTLLDNITLTPVDVSPSPVPEPTTMLLLGTGLAGLAVVRRKKAA